MLLHDLHFNLKCANRNEKTKVIVEVLKKTKTHFKQGSLE